MKITIISLSLGFLAAAVTFAPLAEAGDKGNKDRGLGVGLSVGGPSGINANVGLSAGGRKGMDADVRASVGGKRGVNADATASVGGRKGIAANVDARVGGSQGITADADASVGGRRGLAASADVGVGGSRGLDADVDVNVGGSRGGIDVGVDIDTGGADPDTDKPSRPPRVDSTDPGIDTGDNGDNLTPAKPPLTAFNNLPSQEQHRLLRRCRGITGSSDYDASLVSLCRLLQANASR